MTVIDPEESAAALPTVVERAPGEVVSTRPSESDLSAAQRVGERLDENHRPETNGWMAVCRKCGMRTDGPEGLHAPHPNQIVAAESWLGAAMHGSSIARLRARRDT